MPSGEIRGIRTTNDDADLGLPGDVESWEVDYKSREQMEKITGKSHIGVSGVEVTVVLDGERI